MTIGEYFLRLLLESGSDIIENITKGLTKSSGQSNGDGEKEKSEESKDNVSNSEEVAAKEESSNSNNLEIRNAIVFFNDLYHRFLLSSNMKSMCLQAMTIVYTKCHEEIGPFHDTKYIIGNSLSW